MPFSKQYFSRPALNETSSGFSYKNGQSKMRFSLSSQVKALEGKTSRLTGRIVFYNSDGTTSPLDTNEVLLDDTNYKPVHRHIPNFGGVQCLNDKVRIQSKKSNSEIVTNSNYAQITALKQAYNHNKTDYRNGVFCQSLACGANANNISRRLSIMTPDTEANYTEDQTGQFFSLPIDEAFLQSSNIQLSPDKVAGLLLTLELKNDSDFLNALYRTSATGVDIDGDYYVLKDIRFEGRYVIQTPQELMNLPDITVLSEFENLLNDIQSSNSSTTYTPNFQSVQSIINMFQPTDQKNNYNRNLNEFTYPYGLRSYVQAKDSRRYPYDYSISVNPNYSLVNNIDDLQFKVTSQGDSEVRRQFLLTLKDGRMPYHLSANLQLTNDNFESMYETTVPTANVGTHNNLLIDVLGLGTNYSHNISSQVENYNNKDYSLQINSGVNTGNGNLPVDYNEVSLTQESFVKHLSLFDFQNLNKTM